ncbi:transposase [bacterium]|nr:transposase [bacterium]
MPKRPLIRTDVFPYHIYARSNNKDPFPIPLNQVWEICLKYFEKTHEQYKHKTYAFVLMPNHFHLLIKTPYANIDKIMHYWMREVSKSITYRAQRINHIFGSSYKWCIIQDSIYYSNIYRYIYRNPVKANLCPNVEMYPYSSLKYLLAPEIKPHFYLFDDEYIELSEIIPRNIQKRLSWLNTCFSAKESELIKKGLNRTVFAYSKSRRFYKVRDHLIKYPLGLSTTKYPKV